MTWEIIFLKFNADQTDSTYVNGELAKCPGYEPFDSYWDGTTTWWLLLKRNLPADLPAGA